MSCLQIKQEKKTNIKLFIKIHDMFPMVTGFMNYGQQTIRAARYVRSFSDSVFLSFFITWPL